MADLKKLEAQLSLQQRKAALLVVESDMLGNKHEEKKTYQEIADEVGCDRNTLLNWRKRNAPFIEYTNALADDMLSSHRAEVYSQLLKSIRADQPSIKAMDLFFKRFGLLTERQVTETVESGDQRSSEDLKRELEEIDDLLKEEE